MKSLAIVINNYNYAPYLAACVESALEQAQAADELIVVDDGSTDTSRDILARYQDRVRLIFKPNGGQASAINAGFAATRSDWILFLDADDRLCPEAVASIRSQWRAGAALIHFRMAIINADDERIGQFPPPGETLPAGQLLPRLLREGTCPRMPTSGNVFARTALEAIMPIPEAAYRISADLYLCLRTLAQGEVQAIDAVLASYRAHGKNRFSSGRLVAPTVDALLPRVASHRARVDLLTAEAQEAAYPLPLPARVYYTTFYGWLDLALACRLRSEAAIAPWDARVILPGVRARLRTRYRGWNRRLAAIAIIPVFLFLMHAPRGLVAGAFWLAGRAEPRLIAPIVRALTRRQATP